VTPFDPARCSSVIPDIIRGWQEKYDVFLRVNRRKQPKNALANQNGKQQPFVRPLAERQGRKAAQRRLSSRHLQVRRVLARARIDGGRAEGAGSAGPPGPAMNAARSAVAGDCRSRQDVAAQPPRTGGEHGGRRRGIVTRMGGDRRRPKRSAGRRLAPVSWTGATRTALRTRARSPIGDAQSGHSIGHSYGHYTGHSNSVL